MKGLIRDQFESKFGPTVTICHFSLITIIYPHEITGHSLYHVYSKFTIGCIGL